MMFISYDDARKMFGADDFDAAEWEKRHILGLCASLINALETIDPKYIGNLAKTGKRYLNNHAGTAAVEEYAKLRSIVIQLDKVTE